MMLSRSMAHSWTLHLLALIMLTQSTPALGEEFQVLVGDASANGAHVDTYQPATLSAGLGDTIIFIFMGNHTVTQTGYSSPCGPAPADSFDSGHLLQGNNFSVAITDFQPVWIRCSKSCNAGMVAAINPPTDGGQSYEQFRANALGAGPALPTSTTLGSGPSTAPPVPATTHSTSSTTVSSPAASLSGTPSSQGAAGPSRSTVSWPIILTFSLLALLLSR